MAKLKIRNVHWKFWNDLNFFKNNKTYIVYNDRQLVRDNGLPYLSHEHEYLVDSKNVARIQEVNSRYYYVKEEDYNRLRNITEQSYYITNNQPLRARNKGLVRLKRYAQPYLLINRRPRLNKYIRENA